jgi:hypothetical protein
VRLKGIQEGTVSQVHDPQDQRSARGEHAGQLVQWTLRIGQAIAGL